MGKSHLEVVEGCGEGEQQGNMVQILQRPVLGNHLTSENGALNLALQQAGRYHCSAPNTLSHFFLKLKLEFKATLICNVPKVLHIYEGKSHRVEIFRILEMPISSFKLSIPEKLIFKARYDYAPIRISKIQTIVVPTC